MKRVYLAGRDRIHFALAFFLAVGLTSALWITTSPMEAARMMTATEMIEAGLPPGILMKTASKPQFLIAVCGAVKDHRKAAPAIAETAVGAHHEYAGDIVATVIRCANGNCELTAEIAGSAVAAAPESAVTIDDAAVASAPDCADAIQAATSKASQEPHAPPAEDGSPDVGTPPSISPPVLDTGGGGGGSNPQNAVVGVCDNGQDRSIASGDVRHFLATHPGSFVGRCQVTPVTSR
jgi:hypothetical protein